MIYMHYMMCSSLGRGGMRGGGRWQKVHRNQWMVDQYRTDRREGERASYSIRVTKTRYMFSWLKETRTHTLNVQNLTKTHTSKSEHHIYNSNTSVDTTIWVAYVYLETVSNCRCMVLNWLILKWLFWGVLFSVIIILFIFGCWKKMTYYWWSTNLEALGD